MYTFACLLKHTKIYSKKVKKESIYLLKIKCQFNCWLCSKYIFYLFLTITLKRNKCSFLIESYKTDIFLVILMKLFRQAKNVSSSSQFTSLLASEHNEHMLMISCFALINKTGVLDLHSQLGLLLIANLAKIN